MLAPLLPLFIPQMQLSLAAAGLLQTIFQMASSVAQLAFGHLADRWRHGRCSIAGPLLSVAVLPLVGLAQGPVTLAADPRRRRAGRARPFIRPRRRWSTR